MRVFVSDKIGSERLDFWRGNLVFGKANYSWKIISSLYGAALRKMGIEVIELARPETFQSPLAKETLGLSSRDFHLAIKPIEHLRTMPHIKNFYVCGWEFPEFSESNYGVSPFLNQIKILGSAQAVICWTDYTANNLLSYGVNAISLPPPVYIEDPAVCDKNVLCGLNFVELDTGGRPGFDKVRDFSVLKKYIDSGADVFVSVLNPFDRRKDIRALLEGFSAAVSCGVNAIFVVKLVIDNKSTTVHNINELLRVHYSLDVINERIFFIGEELDVFGMAAIYSLADFYLCASSAEGLNLPILEALRYGVVPVSTFNSAMGDYLDHSRGIEIRCEKNSMREVAHSLSDYLSVTHFPTNSDYVCEGVQRACSTSSDQRGNLNGSAREFCDEKFGFNIFSEKFGKLVGDFL